MEPLPAPGAVYSGFRCQAVGRYVPGLDVLPLEFVHERTGQRFVKLQSRNRVEATFVMSFYTPPENHCGLPHICEHTVLSGSEKFPLKDAFNEMYKSSLKTFLNAMTYSDYTVYPIRSYCEQDFYNLVTVYLDSILRPILYKNPLVFYQEGFHYEIKDGKLTEQGIVLNEMKGVFDDPGSVAMEIGESISFKDSPLQYVSGGHPKHIIKLKPNDLSEFHASHYNNKNSVMIINSMFSWKKELEFLDANIDGNFHTAGKTKIPYIYQEDYKESKHIALPINRESDSNDGEGEKENKEEENKNGKFYRFILGPKYDNRLEIFGLMIADYILHDTPSSPVKVAAESCLCSSFSSNIDNSSGRSFIALTFNQTSTSDLESKWNEEFKKNDKIEQLDDITGTETHNKFDSFIKEIYEEVCEPGKYEKSGKQWYDKIKSFKLTESLIESVVDKMELEIMDFKDSTIMYKIIDSAKVYHYSDAEGPRYEDFIDNMEPRKYLDSMRELLKQGKATDYIKEIIKKYFINGTHNDIVQVPIKNYKQLEEKRDRERVDSVYKNMSEEKKEDIKKLMNELIEFQNEDESDRIKLLPVLTIDDIRKDVGIPEMIKNLGYETCEVNGIKVYKTKSDIFKNSGINVFRVFIDITDLASPKNLSYIKAITRLLSKISTEHYSVYELTEKVNRTGSIRFSTDTNIYSPFTGRVFISVSGTCLKSKTQELIKLINEIIFHTHQCIDKEDNIVASIDKLRSTITSSKRTIGKEIFRIVLGRSSEMKAYLLETLDGIEFLRGLARIKELGDQIKDTNDEYVPLAEKLGKQGSIPYCEFIKMASAFYVNIIHDKKRYAIVTTEEDVEMIEKHLFGGESMKECVDSKNNYWNHHNGIGWDLPEEEKKLIREVAQYYLRRSIALPIDCCYVGMNGSVSSDKENMLGTDDGDAIKRAKEHKERLESGITMILKNYYENGYLWNKIRNESGAYGVFLVINKCSNVISAVSYRDPHLEKTVKTYRALPLATNHTELDKAKNGAVSKLQPRCTCRDLFTNVVDLILSEETPDDVIERFNEVLDANYDECKKSSEEFVKIFGEGAISVAAYESKLRDAKDNGVISKWEKMVE